MQKSQFTIYETYTRFTVSTVYVIQNNVVPILESSNTKSDKKPKTCFTNLESETIPQICNQNKSLEKSTTKIGPVEYKENRLKKTKLQKMEHYTASIKPKTSNHSRKNIISPDITLIRPCKRHDTHEMQYALRQQKRESDNVCQLAERLYSVTFKNLKSESSLVTSRSSKCESSLVTCKS